MGPPAWLVDILLAAEAAATLKRAEGHSKVATDVGRIIPIKHISITHEMAGDVPETGIAPDACEPEDKVGRDDPSWRVAYIKRVQKLAQLSGTGRLE